MSIQLNIYQTLAAAMVVYYAGVFLRMKISALRTYCIPAPVIGGILLQRFAWDSVVWVCAVIGTLAICAAFLCLFGFIFLTT